MPQPLVVANWKMNGSTEFIDAFAADFLSVDISGLQTKVVVCPPSLYLQKVVHRFVESVVEIGAQDLSRHAPGAYTGEASADMLVDLGAKWVIVGHSERRSYHAETDELVVAKTNAALEQGLTPICCVGETLQDRESGNTQAIVGKQVDALINAFEATGALKNIVIAYEPVWAIGTGKTATPAQAQEVHSFIRNKLGAAGSNVPLLYGGSVKPDNAKELFGQPDIDGGLIGCASLVPQDFIEICRAADGREN